MNENGSRLDAKKLSASLLILGLLTEAVTLYWFNPMSFLFYLCLGGLSVLAGVALYLLAYSANND
jgi:hypothetical protein